MLRPAISTSITFQAKDHALEADKNGYDATRDWSTLVNHHPPGPHCSDPDAAGFLNCQNDDATNRTAARRPHSVCPRRPRGVRLTSIKRTWERAQVRGAISSVVRSRLEASLPGALLPPRNVRERTG